MNTPTVTRRWRPSHHPLWTALVAIAAGTAIAVPSLFGALPASAATKPPPPPPGPVFTPTGLPGQTNLPRTNEFLRGSPVYMEGGNHLTLTQAVALAQSTNLIVTVTGDVSGLVPAMKAANPNLTVLIYMNGTFAQKTQGSSYPASEYMTGADGNKVRSIGFGNYLMRFNTPAWQQDRISTCASFIATGPNFDGCFVDMMGSGSLYPGYLTEAPINSATGLAWTPQDWLNGTSALLKTIKAGNPATTNAGNGIGNGARWYNTKTVDQSVLATNANIVMAETWAIDSAAPLTTFSTVARWQQDVNALGAVEATGSSVLAVVKTWGPGTADQVAQWHSFSLASFMLGTAGHSYYSFLANTTTAPSSDSPIEHQNIGQPLGGYGYSSGVYVRYFSAGLAIVNPGITTVTYTLPAGSYSAEDGTPYSGSITLAPHTGHVLSLP
jgi:hypothetical protein